VRPAPSPARHPVSGGNHGPGADHLDQPRCDLEWYYGERALVSVGVFSMDIDDYVTLSNVQRTFLTEDTSPIR
jgi:hypothetical protein